MARKYLLTIAVILAIFCAYFLIFNIPVGYSSLNMDMQITNNTGEKLINVVTGCGETDNIHFYGVPPCTTAIKNISIKNLYPENKFIYVSANGQLADWIEISPTKFKLAPNSSKEIQLTARAPCGAKPGNYTGKLIIAFYRSL